MRASEIWRNHSRETQGQEVLLQECRRKRMKVSERGDVKRGRGEGLV